MLYDYNAEAERECQKKAYNELIEFLKLKKSLKHLPKKSDAYDYLISDAYDYLINREEELKEKDEKIKKYENFFKTLASFLPRESSIHDLIG